MTPRHIVLTCCAGLAVVFMLAMLGVIGTPQKNSALALALVSNLNEQHKLLDGIFERIYAEDAIDLQPPELRYPLTFRRPKWCITTNWLVEPKDRMLLGPFPRTQRFLEYGVVQSNLVAELVYGVKTNLITLESHPQQSITREYDVTITPRP